MRGADLVAFTDVAVLTPDFVVAAPPNPDMNRHPPVPIAI
jgi:hypothetical protein